MGLAQRRHLSRIAPLWALSFSLIGTWSPGAVWAAAGDASTRADALKKLLPVEIDDTRITAAVVAPTADRVVVTLTGEVYTTEEEQHFVKVVKDADPKAEIRSRIFVRSPTLPAQPEPEVTDLWTLTYIRSRVSSTLGASILQPSTPDNIDLLVEALNSSFGDSGRTAVQRAGGGRLLLRGTKRRIIEIKRVLALVDAPWPQVQMNMWAVQVSGSPESVGWRVHMIGELVRTVRDQMAEVQRILAETVVEGSGTELQGLQEQFKIAGISLPYDGPLSVNESLLFLTLLEGRYRKLDKFQEKVSSRCSAWAEQVGDDPRTCPHRVEPFRRLKDFLVQETFQADRRAFLRFRNALYCFKDKERWPFRPDSPSGLVRTGATVDRVLKSVNDAFAADMNDLFLDPLLERIQAVGAGRRRDRGVSLVGRTRIVVTSGLEAGLAPEMASFVESGRPKPFGTELLNLAFPSSEAGTNTKPDVLTGASKVLAGLPDAQALLLAAALSADPEPAFTKVAPGIAVNVRPTVLPDGGAARITVDARFGVASTPQDTTRTDIWREAPPAGISSHNLHTDAAVSAFDLFDISSFSVTASHPRTPFYIPILGRLPILGPAFQIPRRNKEVLFESLVLVNTVILPRSIELHRFYGREITPRKAPGINCREEEEDTPATERADLPVDTGR